MYININEGKLSLVAGEASVALLQLVMEAPDEKMINIKQQMQAGRNGVRNARLSLPFGQYHQQLKKTRKGEKQLL
jgi:hypothetical protein